MYFEKTPDALQDTGIIVDDDYQFTHQALRLKAVPMGTTFRSK